MKRKDVVKLRKEEMQFRANKLLSVENAETAYAKLLLSGLNPEETFGVHAGR